jgi:hypothetical protein
MMVVDHLEQLWGRYMDAFHTADEVERQDLLEQCVCDDVAFTNPGGDGNSRAGLSAHIGIFRKAMPGAYFSTDTVFVHHGELLAVWSLYKPDGSKAAAGYNFVRPGPDGRFGYMAGFF